MPRKFTGFLYVLTLFISGPIAAAPLEQNRAFTNTIREVAHVDLLTTHTIVPQKLYWLEGAGGNSGVLIGDNGVIIIDAKTTKDAGLAIAAEIAKLTIKPITDVILTHSDGDHVNGLAGLPDGLRIIAHEDAKLDLITAYQLASAEVGGGKCLPPANRLPNVIIFRDRVDTVLDGERVILHHFGPAHTSGDLVVELPAYHFAFVGDLLTNTVLIHSEKGGSLAGWFTSTDDLLKMKVDRYLGGHATTTDSKASIRERISAYKEKRSEVDRLVDNGANLAQVKLAMGDPPKEPGGCRGITWLSFANTEFNEKTDRNAELK